MAAVQRRRLKAPNSVQFIFHLFRNVCLFYLVSVPRKRIGYRPFQLPAQDETLHRQWTELEFGSYHYPVNSLSPCHKGLVYGAHLKYIIERRKKKHISIINTREWKEYNSSHIECTFILRSFNRVQWPNAFFPNHIQTWQSLWRQICWPDRSCTLTPRIDEQNQKVSTWTQAPHVSLITYSH